VVLLGILDPDPPAPKAKDGQDAEAHTTLCSVLHALSGAFGELDHKIIPGCRSASPVVHAPQLGRHELAWAALNREQQSSLLAELRELPDIENYSIQEFLCRRSVEDPRTVPALLGQRIELVLKRPHLEGLVAAMTSGAARSNLLRWLLGSRDLKLEDHVMRSQPTSSSARSGPTAAIGRVTDDQWGPGHSHVTADGHASAIGRNSACFRSGLVGRSVRQRTAANTPGPRKAGFRAVGGRKPRRELRLAASMFDATPSRADLIERRFSRSEPNFHPAEDAGFEPARACTQPAFQIRKPRSRRDHRSSFTLGKRSFGRLRTPTNGDN
jgi:hypothetical protein